MSDLDGKVRDLELAKVTQDGKNQIVEGRITNAEDRLDGVEEELDKHSIFKTTVEKWLFGVRVFLGAAVVFTAILLLGIKQAFLKLLGID